MLKEFIKKFTDKEIVDFKLVKKLRTDYFILSAELIKASQKITRPFLYGGIYLGKEKKQFVPSLYLLQKLAEVSDKKVWLDEKNEWLFICKKDAKLQKVSKAKENEFVLVLNKNNECLGYGILGKERVKNLFDIGDFLRREK